MRLVTRKPFPFCVTPQTYDESHVEGEGIHPFRLTLAQAFDWYWRARQWALVISHSNGVNASSIDYSERFSGWNEDIGTFPVYENEKLRNCAKAGLMGNGYPGTDPLALVDVDLRFFGPGNPDALFPSIPAVAALEGTLATVPRLIREDNAGTITYRPLIIWAVRYLVEDELDSFFTNSEDLAEAYLDQFAGNEIVPATGSFDGREMQFFGIQPDDSPAEHEWDFAINVNEWFPFANMAGADPIYDTVTGNLLPGKDPFAHLNPLE